MRKHYPAIVIQNHRYRGPMESKKDNDFIEDVYSSITHLRSLFATNAERVGELMTDVNKLNNEKGNIHIQLHRFEEQLLILEGGELR